METEGRTDTPSGLNGFAAAGPAYTPLGALLGYQKTQDNIDFYMSPHNVTGLATAFTYAYANVAA